jgi:hypothetical protein
MTSRADSPSAARRLSVRRHHRGCWLLSCLLFLCLLVRPDAANAAPQSLSLDELARDPAWLALGHYHPSRLQLGRIESDVAQGSFFLSRQGRTDPLAELEATLAVFQRARDPADPHPACRHPARYEWLLKRSLLPAERPPVCPEFDRWFADIGPHSLVLVFASSYLNSPSSMFGHTFLRIDPAGVKQGSVLLSHVVNFGATFDPDDNSLLYAYRGIFGGYGGFFSVMNYYEKIREYNHLENRDLWEYSLTLNPEEVRYVTAHLWELKDQTLDYFFFDENCSYRLLELIGVARPDARLPAQFPLQAIPLDTVRVVKDAGLVSGVLYRPSRVARLEHLARPLSASSRRLAVEMSVEGLPPDAAGVAGLSDQERARTVAVAYEHVRYLQSREQREDIKASRSLALLRASRQLPPVESASPPTPTHPEAGHDSFLVGVGRTVSDEGQGTDLRLRFSYHDLHDNPSGYLDGAAINLGDVQFHRQDDGETRLEEFDAVDIASHSPRTRFFQPVTWRVRGGVERLHGLEDHGLVSHVTGGAGGTWLAGQRHLVWIMAMGRLEYGEVREDHAVAGAGLLAGSLWYLPLGSLGIEAEGLRLNSADSVGSASLVWNLPVGRHQAVRVSASRVRELDLIETRAGVEARFHF